MDNQLKRGLLDICVLAAIKPEPSYGYKIIKDVKPYITISESTLYPILRRLEDSGSLNVNSVEHNGRLRKYYEITNSGHKRLVDFTEEWREIMAIYEFVTKEVGTPQTSPAEAGTGEAGTNEAEAPQASSAEAGTGEAGTSEADASQASTTETGTNEAEATQAEIKEGETNE